jgi:hypothetical protein
MHSHRKTQIRLWRLYRYGSVVPQWYVFQCVTVRVFCLQREALDDEDLELSAGPLPLPVLVLVLSLPHAIGLAVFLALRSSIRKSMRNVDTVPTALLACSLARTLCIQLYARTRT